MFPERSRSIVLHAAIFKAQIPISNQVLSDLIYCTVDPSLHRDAGSASFMFPRIHLSGEKEYFPMSKTQTTYFSFLYWQLQKLQSNTEGEEFVSPREF